MLLTISFFIFALVGAESRFLNAIQPDFYRECLEHKLRGKSYEGERRLYRMLKLLVQSKNAEVLSVLDSNDGKAMVENQSKLFPCPHCGLLFTRYGFKRNCNFFHCLGKNLNQ